MCEYQTVKEIGDKKILKCKDGEFCTFCVFGDKKRYCELKVKK